MARAILLPGLLLAMPESSDLNLSRAVLLLIRHKAQGSFGLVINRPSEIKVGPVLTSLGMTWRGNAADTAWRGGPVAVDHGRVLHEPVASVAGPGTVAITPALAMSTTPDRLRALAGDPPARFRLVFGSIDWAPGQLADAMSGDEVYADADPSLVFEPDPERMWQRVRSVGIQPAGGLGARLRRLLGLGPAIPRAILRR